MLAALLLSLSPAAGAAERWEGLRALPRLALEVTASPAHPDISAEDLRQRVTDALRRAQPAPAIDPASADRLHLRVAVRAYSSAELRGFYLPFSGRYGIGPVRLAVERPAVIPGLSGPVLATTWDAERQARAPWHRSAEEILDLADEVIASFLADYRRAAGP
jgi:hypothetical protein